MSFFDWSDFQSLADPRAADPAADVDRVRLRDKLAWLHQQIYPEILARRLDLHPHWNSQYLISSARLGPAIPRIDFLLLRYSKAETIVQRMKKEFGEDFSHPYRTGMLDVRADGQGLYVELLVTDRASIDGRNLKRKLGQDAPAKHQLPQFFADLGGDYTLTLELPDRCELLRLRCTRLLHPGTLDDVFTRYTPSEHQLRVAIHYSPGDLRLGTDRLPEEILLRLGQLYPLYQFISWSPRNDYLSQPRPGDYQSDSNS